MADSLLKIKPNVAGASFTAIPCPSTYKMTSTTLVKSGRNTKGILQTTVVREGVRKIEISWKFLSVSDFSALAKMFEGATTGGTGAFDFYLQYWDTVLGKFIDSSQGYYEVGVGAISGASSSPRLFYVGDRITDTAQMQLDANNQPKGYVNAKLSLIEC